ncbi:MAG: tRNA lysidine(34) synthetase TilS [Blastocatellia bacterium]|nr:tRNA lysidine(34) synthetase TilS [Blastocatellia bacterium]MCS7157019.1 tRNA lysidine(34) synthetase TilS [Blastocatellia bacterium]MCX7752220.1 tRNA lysidine(34) synthetase TilS [Blastocatellia bacterium]MDW8167712.1 tRNA lysidine(34) synthetase TilS [Acidobacteriota bacterium]MDW8256311.1 tRNA lysidine(34) synthetase TilS [Acidobacteriota bacterium]
MALDRAALLAKVRATITRYGMLEDGDLIVVAVSGGPDSVALLHLLNELRDSAYPHLRLHVAHLNHQLRGEEADADEAFVQQLAERLDLPFTSERQDVRALAQAEGRNLEEVAREVRYAFLRRVAAEVGARRIATGHTLTDQAETFLMRLLRGAGIEGLSGIHPIVDDLIIRPLLAVRREETRAYCEALGIPYRVDRSNLELERWRNRVRQELLPRLLALNPRALEAIGRAAERLRVDETYFDEILGNVFPDAVISYERDMIRLSVEKLRALHPALRARALREAIRQLCGHTRRVTSQHVEALDQLLEPGKSGRRVLLPAAVIAWREFDALTFMRRPQRPQPYWRELRPSEPIEVAGFVIRWERGRTEAPPSSDRIVVLDDERVPERLAVRSRRPGDRYVPVGRRRPLKLKTLMWAHRIPVSERDRWPLVVTADEDRIVCAPALPVAAEFAVHSETQRLAVIRFERGRE